MTLQDIQSRLDEIRELVHDAEVAHGLEDRLFVDLLEFIAQQTTCEFAPLCAEALKSLDIEFGRYCA